MKLWDRLHAWHRLLRYRWHSERVEMDFLLGCEAAGGSVLDIGANRGVWSFWLHRAFPGTEVVAFEPQPELAQYLAEFKDAFRLDRLRIVPQGLSSHDGVVDMHRPRHHWGAATVEAMDDHAHTDVEVDTLQVPVTTLDRYLAEHAELRPVQLVKCDVEGHEADVLAGAECTLREDRPTLLVEWSTCDAARRRKLMALVTSLDYDVLQFERGRLVPCTTAERHRPPSWDLGANYVFVPQESLVPRAENQEPEVQLATRK